MKNRVLKYCLIFFLILGISCDNDDNDGIPQDLEVHNFVWMGLNAFYFWQQDMPDLSDQRFSSQEQLNAFLDDYSDPENLFYSLLNDYPNTDKYSWIVDDYLALDDLLQSNISDTNGVDFGLNFIDGSETDLYGYVRYIIAGSDASSKNIERGDIFIGVNGVPLTISNYRELLLSTQSYTLNMADYNNGTPTSNGVSVDLTKSDIQENPIYSVETFDIAGKRIGYLMYNSFTPDFDEELNDVFAYFLSEGVTDLIVDLRYNSGGRVSSSSYLASMITGQFTGELFAQELWNDKWQNYFLANEPDRIINNFTDQIVDGSAINSLQMNNVVIITTGSSASASELLINGLAPYIDVRTIGTQTEGKIFGSVTLYDSPFYLREGANPNHTWAMQPLALEIQNSLGNNAPEGISPDILLPEDKSNMGVIGDINEPLLNRAITYLTTGSRSDIAQEPQKETRLFSTSKDLYGYGSTMFVELK